MNNDWIIWNGGKNPVPRKRVQIQRRSDTRYEAEKSVEREADKLFWGHLGLFWGHLGNVSDIIAYRVIPEPLWAEVRSGFYGIDNRILLDESRRLEDAIILRIPMKLTNGKREFDKSRQPEWGEL